MLMTMAEVIVRNMMTDSLKPCPFCGQTAKNFGEDFCTCSNKECPLAFVQIRVSKWQSRPLEEQKDTQIQELQASLQDEISFSGVVFAASNFKG